MADGFQIFDTSDSFHSPDGAAIEAKLFGTGYLFKQFGPEIVIYTSEQNVYTSYWWDHNGCDADVI